MQEKQDVNYSLFCAVRSGKLERVRELINDFGLFYSRAWSGGYNLLRDAVENKHAAVAKLLLKRGARVNSRSGNPCYTPLHFAVINGDIEIVEMLLGKGANVNAFGHSGKTPLHIAIAKLNMKLTAVLLAHGADANANNSCELSPFHFAVEKGSKKMITLLLRRGTKVDVKGKNGLTPLHIAAQKGYIDIANDLLNHGASIHSFTLEEGYTPLHFACQLGKEESVKLFLNKGADINASMNGNSTPLHTAIRNGHKTVVKLLLQHGAKIDIHENDGKTTLYLAVSSGCLTIVEDILKHSPDINDRSNKSSLKMAVCSYGIHYINIVNALLEYGLSVNPEDINDPNLINSSVEKGYLKIIEDLLKHGANVNTSYYSIDGTSLHIACKNKREDIAKLLISYEADVNAQNTVGKTPIFYAIENADIKITNLLLTSGATIKDEPDLLNIAIQKNCIEIVEVLLQYNADVNASDKYGRTALHFTALNEESFRYLKGDSDVNIMGEIAKLLLSKGANVDALNKDGVTALEAAIKNGYVKVVEALLIYNANVNSRTKRSITPLFLSARLGNEEICTMILKKGANVNAKQSNGYTALHIAAQNGHKEVIKVLLQWGAEVDSKTKYGYTILHMINTNSVNDCQEIIETILKYGANIDSRDEYGRTALHIASATGNSKVIATLLEYGSDINITSISNYTALDYATEELGFFCSTLPYNYNADDDYFYPVRGVCTYELTAQALKRHIVKMKIANLYVSEENLLSTSSCDEPSYFVKQCEEEIARMKSEKIKPYFSFYDILAKGISSLAIYMRNEYIVRILKLEGYKIKFPIYASMIKSNFRKAMERKDLLEQDNQIFHFLFNNFPELPYDCIEKILSYLSNEDLKILVDACKTQH